MANKIANRVKMTVASVASSGTGDITLGAKVTGYMTFAEAGVSNADTVPYVLEAANGDWEIGVGTYTSSGTVLARTSVTKSAIDGVVGTSKITASSTTIVMISPLAADLQAGTAAGNLVQLDSTASIPVSNGGTGLTSLTAGYIPYGNGTSAFNVSPVYTNGTAVGVNTTTFYSGNLFQVSNSTNGALRICADNQNTGGSALAGLSLQASGGGWYIDVPPSATYTNSLLFKFGSTQNMELTSAGNLGLGVTPSAWGSIYKVIDVNSYGSLAGSSGIFGMYGNMLFNGSNYVFKSAAAASMYIQNAGTHVWYRSTNASPSQGATVTLDQAMTLDASGRLGVGETSPSKLISLLGSSATVRIKDTGANGAILDLISTNTDAIIDATGSSAASQNIVFKTGNTDRARIDASGNWIVGDTATVYSDTKVTLKNTANTRNTVVWASNASLTADIFIVRADRNTTNNSFYAINYYNDGAGAYKFRVADSGNVTNSNNSYGQISDINLKENIVDATPKLNDLLSVKIKNFNFIGDSTKQIGVVAQELEKVFPSLVETSVQDGVKSVKYSVFTPIIIKALQELAAKEQELRSKVSALEAKQ